MSGYPDFQVLLVDDEDAWLRSLKRMLNRVAGISNVLTCQDSRHVPELLAANDIGLVLLDLNMPWRNGEETLKDILSLSPGTQVIILSGMNDAESAVRCMKHGAFDYFVKVWDEERLVTAISHAIRLVMLMRQSGDLSRTIIRKTLVRPNLFEDIITASPDMMLLFRYIEAVAPSAQPVLITGESGVGKELVARSVHRASDRKGPFIAVNVASLDETRLEDTLFGHSQGAFTSALRDRNGLVEQASNGTLFLDEIGELSTNSQARLLRFLQEGEYYPIGSDMPRQSRCRLVLATNRDLSQSQKDGCFRSDLYYRLMMHPIHVPPLRERREDIPLLARHFAREAAQEMGRKEPQFPLELLLKIGRCSFPGNVRELRGMIIHAVSICGDILEERAFPCLQEQEETALSMTGEKELLDLFLRMKPLPSIADVKRIMTTAALSLTGGNQSAAAKLLGISQPAVNKRIRAES